MTAVYLLVLVLLLLLNAFYVLAEFAAVKVRGTQIEALKEQHPSGAKVLEHVHRHLDEYLSVCQLGITLASIGLGFVGEPAIAKMLEPLLGHTATAHIVAITISYIVVSFLHILVGELLPKSVAIRFAETSALLTARPLVWSRRALYLPLVVLNGTANAILRMFGVGTALKDTAPSEAEVRIILEESQREGMMPFRRLLLMENVFDFGDVKVRDEMRKMDQVTALYADKPWEENRQKLMSSTFTRYPLLEGDPPKPVGIVHIKDLLHLDTPWAEPEDLRRIARKTFITSPDMLLEQLLTELRRRHVHMAVVQDAEGRVCGVITMEDILEQLVGAIEDEFEKDTPVRLGDVLAEDRILLDLNARSSMGAIEEIIRRCRFDDPALTKQAVIEAVQARERSLPTLLGQGVAVPHARLDAVKQPLLFFARSASGVIFDPQKTEERARIIFLLLTPGATPRMQTRLLARIANLRESEYVWDRLLEAQSTAEALEAIRSGDEIAGT